ncbi:MAG: hypothetical protein PHV74_13885 [Dehalococcoidia bacterium]|nr:hypothetical protein [Dehalococcoidia bacterium]
MTISIRKGVKLYEFIGNEWVAVPGNVLSGLFDVKSMTSLSYDGLVVTHG